MDLTALVTPALVLDRQRLAANGARMRARAAALGVALRPHVKTLKSVEALRHALPEVTAITVSTLAEAEHFAAAGYRDILYGVGIVPSKLPRVAALRAAGIDLKVTLDSPAAAEALAAAGGQNHTAVIEIDCGAGRGGVAALSDLLPAIAAILQRGGVALAGVMTHAGQSYGAADPAAIRAIARDERDAVVLAATRLRAGGHACPLVSVGSTPTALFAEDLSGVTEMRPGVFFAMDLYQAGLGCCRRDELAVSVVTSVIGRRPEGDTVLIDAGALALSQDRSTGQQSGDAGYGLAGPLNGPPWPGARVARVNQEHGFLTFDDPARAAELAIGQRLRIWPNHACMTAAAWPDYAVTEGDGSIVARWPRVNYW